MVKPWFWEVMETFLFLSLLLVDLSLYVQISFCISWHQRPGNDLLP